VSIDQRFIAAHARLAEAYAELDMGDKAKDQVIRAATIAPDRSSLSPAEARLLEAAQFMVSREFEKAERAIEIASSIEDNDHRTSALTQLSAVFTLRREDEYARRALNEISDDAERAYALISMSDAEEQLSERVPANQLLEEAFHLIDEVPQLTARSMAYNEIARRFLERGETQQAAEIFTVSLRTVGDIRDESTRAKNLASLSDLLVGGGIELTDEQQQMVENLLSRK